MQLYECIMDVVKLEQQINRASSLLEMLAQPARLKILCTLLEGESSVLELARNVGLSQPAMSHHLRKLRDAELVQTRRDAQTIYYNLKGSEVRAVMTVLYELYCS